MNIPVSQNKQSGLTLVEVMVAIVISLILLTGVIQIFVGNKQTYSKTEALSRVQENGRFAMDYIAKEIRMADFWGCANNDANPGLVITNNLNPPNPPDTPASHPVDPSAGGITGTNNTGLNGSDTLILQGAYGGGLGLVTHSEPAASYQLSTVNHGLNDGDVIMATDCDKADVIEVTNSNPGVNSNIVANLGNNDPGFGNVSKAVQYNDSATIYRVRTIIYSIKAGASGEPALFRNENGNDVELVEGVQDMQVLYGEDIDDDNTANRYLSAAAVTDFDNVVSIRVTLTLRTLKDLRRSGAAAGAAAGAAGAAGPGPGPGPAANFGRILRTYSTTSTIRNRVI